MFAVLTASLLSLAHAQTTIPAGSIGNAACEADYNSVTQAFTKCGAFDTANIVHFANGTNSVLMCLCKPDNLNTLTGIKSSCRSIPAVEETWQSAIVIAYDCASFASGSPLPIHQQQPTGTAISSPDGRLISKECAAGRDSVDTISTTCKLPEGTLTVASMNQPLVNCLCDNYSMLESGITSCVPYMEKTEFVYAKGILSDLKPRCGGPTAAQTGTQVNTKSGAVGSVDISFASVAMVVAFAAGTLVI
ncbi:hypothetical protein HDU81_009795 [Chytriomyces hyalinus]|nr:hypothetical protein HDU81_009795 [Chytriomyces hyalinus]